MTVSKGIIFLLSKLMSYHLVSLSVGVTFLPWYDNHSDFYTSFRQEGRWVYLAVSPVLKCLHQNSIIVAPLLLPPPFIRAMTNCATFVVRKEEERRKVKRSVNSDGWFFKRNYRCGTSGSKEAVFPIQGDTSSCSLGLVDTKAEFYYMLLALKHNFCFGVNKTWRTSWCVNL